MSASYRNPTLRSIGAGIVVFILLLAFFSILPSAVKWAGYPLLYLPARLGLVRQVAPADVQNFDLAAFSSQVVASEAGRYAIYTADRELLELDIAAQRAWLKVTSQVTGESVPVELVVRGLRPYDTPYAPGRPVLSFAVDTPGVYEFSRLSLTPPEFVAVVPDYVTGKERVILFLALLQLAVVLGPPAYFLARRRLARLHEAKVTQALQRAEADKMVEVLRRRPG